MNHTKPTAHPELVEGRITRKLMLALLVLSGTNYTHGMLRRVARTAGGLRIMRRVVSKRNLFNRFSLHRKSSLAKKVSNNHTKVQCCKNNQILKKIEKHFKKMNMHTDTFVWVKGKPFHIKQISNDRMLFDELPANYNDANSQQPKKYFIEFLQQSKKLGINFHQNTGLLYLAARETDYLNTCDDCSDKQQSVGDFLLSVYLESEVGLEKMINKQDSRGNTALHELAKSSRSSKLNDNNYDDFVKVLKCYDVNPNIENEYGYTPLHIAAKNGNILAIKQLIALGADVNILNGYVHNLFTELEPRSHRPLYLAIENGDTDTVKALIAAGADINAQSLSKKFARFDGPYCCNYTPVLVAIITGQSHLIRMLIKAGAQVDSKELDALALLHGAAQKGDAQTVRELIALGANVNEVGSWRDTENWLMRGTPIFFATRARSSDTIKVLCTAGADVNSNRTSGGRTPLHYAVKNDDLESVETLIALGADVDLTDFMGWKPYDFISYRTRHYKIFEKLLKPKP